ncbi:aldo/keto reductase [Pinisolibacter sp.]|uniref:aldo/keto reductase n=1 Tax=Pinisolibacter sp. TaxID=2172024 RepID=UPI002FDDBADE
MTLVDRFYAERARGHSPVGLGCMSFGGMYGPTDEATSRATLARALDLGVTFWDTANIYGEGVSEEFIGRFFADHPGTRDRVMLATKFAITKSPDGKRVIDNSPGHMREALSASLKRLGTDRVDLYYVHRYDPAVPIEETIGALADEVKAGRIGAIGLSEVSPDTLRRAAAIHPIAAVQSEYSLWTRTPELGLLDACAELGALFVAFSPLGRGYFCGDLEDPGTLAPSDFRRANPRFEGVNWQRNRAKLQAYLELAASWGVTPSALAIAWTLAKGSHVVPIPGTRTAAHLEDDASAGSVELTAERIAELEHLLPPGFAAGDRYSPSQWLYVERYG